MTIQDGVVQWDDGDMRSAIPVRALNRVRLVGILNFEEIHLSFGAHGEATISFAGSPDEAKVAYNALVAAMQAVV